MKTKHSNFRFIFLILISVFYISCSDKKLDLEIIENKEIKIERYMISELTTVHEFMDLTNKRWNKVERIYEGNVESVDKVYISNDTIFLTTEYDEPIIYDLAAIKFGYKVQLKKE